MKFLKNIVTIAAIFAVGSMGARAIKPAAAPGAAPAPRVAPAPVVVQPVPVKSYKQLHDAVLRMNTDQVIAGNKLNDMFIKKMAQDVSESNFGAVKLRLMLQTARDKFAPFTNNNDEDLKRLMTINKQIDDAVDSF